MDIKTHCPKCQAVFLTELSELVLAELGLQQKSPEVEGEANMAEDFAKLSQNLADMAEAKANLQAEVDRLESKGHSEEVVAHFLDNLDMADPETKTRLGQKLGFGKEAEEVKVKVEEPEKSEEMSELEAIGNFLAGSR